MSTLWNRGRGHHAKKRPHEHQLPRDERREQNALEHPDPEPRWDRVGDEYRREA